MISHNPKSIRHVLPLMCLGLMTVFSITCVTLVPRPTQTPVPVTETSTARPSPTLTATPPPAWVSDFAEPILETIANRPPTYQDDFSDPASAWDTGTSHDPLDPKIAGGRRYEQGEYWIIADGTTSAVPVTCSTSGVPNLDGHADFVAEFDVRFVSGGEGDWQIAFHQKGSELHSLGLRRNGQLLFSKCGPNPDGCSELVSTEGSPINPGEQWNHIQLIVRGPRMAAYVNGTPVLYGEDENDTPVYKKGVGFVGVCNLGPGPLETGWDNFKLWDLSDLP
ncbi:MAG: hypothetical protein FD146_1781 [Anaerolineaceae bacterium]|nr:MAG: hypothetical protein FD146_1781 [Anaerolineaceae bacterium]